MLTATIAWAEFSGLDPADHLIGKLSRHSIAISLDRGKTLFQQNDSGNCVYLIISGQLEARYYTEDGNAIWLADLGQGDLFGESWLHFFQ